MARYLQDHRSLVTVHKVCSHQDIRNLSEAASWIVSGNIAADQAANNAFRILPSHAQALWRRTSDEVKALHRSRSHKSLLSHMARVATLSIQFGKQRLVDAAPEPYTVVREAEPKLSRSFHFDGSGQVFQWLQGIEDLSAPLKEVSFPELLVAFLLATGLIGVESIYTTKHNHRQWRLRNTLDESSFGEVNRSFSAFCCPVIKLAIPDWKVTQGGSSSFRFQYRTGILVVAIRPELLRPTESWFLTHCGSVPFRKASDLMSLPFASGPPQL